MLAWLRVVAHRINETDQAIERRIARIPRSPADDGLKVLTTAANHGLLWFAIAAALASKRGVARRAAVRGVFAIGGASFLANAVGKPVLPRRRPAADSLPDFRTLPDPPTSSSFPSGHAASAAAFATAVTMEAPMAGAVIAPIAATVAYSRVHTGVHWTSDVLGGALLGAGLALATRRWWPVPPQVPARARPRSDAPALPDGSGLVVVANRGSGTSDSVDELTELLPKARIVPVEPGEDLAERLAAELNGAVLDSGRELGPRRPLSAEVPAQEPGSSGGPPARPRSPEAPARAAGVAGGDGSVAAAAAVAEERRVPLAVLPAGNHFARDIGAGTLADAAAAVNAGEAVAVDLATVTVDGRVRRPFVNTASIGGYPDLVRMRERWETRLGKWLAAGLALVRVLAEAKPLHLVLDGRKVAVWLLFVGNGPYHPRGMVPAWRPALDTGLLDIRYLRADVRLSRARFLLAALTGALHRSRTYVQREAPALTVRVLGDPVALATDGEVPMTGSRFDFAVAPGKLTVYRP